MSRNRKLTFGAAIILVAGIAILPFALVGFALWLSDHTHRFGLYDLRYLLLVNGTTVGRLGMQAPERGSIAYAARGRDGNSPAHAHVTFKTKMSPAQVVDTYRSRCRALHLDVKDDPTDLAKLECTGPNGDEIGITAQRADTDASTTVHLGGWVF